MQTEEREREHGREQEVNAKVKVCSLVARGVVGYRSKLEQLQNRS